MCSLILVSWLSGNDVNSKEICMKYVLFGHGGSGNHGCEAIVRTTLKMLPEGSEIEVYSTDIGRDRKFGISDEANFFQYRNRKDSKPEYYLSKVIYKISGNYDPINRFALKRALENQNAVCLSVGGDNYCNAEPRRHASRNKLFSKKNKTVLWGCSVTPELMDDPFFVEDMKRYSLITARESITYNALKKAGISKVELVSDPAFTLERQKIELPALFGNRRVVGINVSPLVMKYEQGSNILLKNIEELIEFLLSETDYGIALIPHVLLPKNNDLVPLRKLYEAYRESGRICMIDDDDTLNCCQLKYVISNCAFMVAARTHASIAAYSTSVPTLVLGYSVKSKGIATDLFGTADHYVLPVDQITGDQEVKEAFKWILDHEESIRNCYREIMPDYIRKAFTAAELIKGL